MKAPLKASNKEHELHDSLTREAMAEVDSGLGIDDVDIKAWADSFDGPDPLPMPRPKPLS